MVVKVVLLFIFSITVIIPPLACENPLYLTPLLDQSKTEEARNYSTVDPLHFLNVRSYTGFLTVDKKFNSNLFFWYFPNSNRVLKETPWIIWLQGGPGGSSVIGLFSEVGPFKIDNGILKLREYSWCTDFSMVFIDNPIGAGFSFTENVAGYPRNMDMYSENLYNAVKQLTVLYPELGQAPLYIAGESYAGRYIPALAMKIYKGRNGDNKINLKGLIMGNPVLDRDSTVDYTRVYYNWGLVDTQGALAVQPLQKQYEQAIKDGDTETAIKLWDNVLNELGDISFRRETYNVLNDHTGDYVNKFIPFIQSNLVRSYIHVANATFDFVNQNTKKYIMQSDFMAPVSAKIEVLLGTYKILIYCGQLDLTTPCVLNAEGRRRKWQWSGRQSFLSSPRVPWMLRNNVAGYLKKGGGLTEVLVSGAGHMVPIDKPQEMQLLILSFINDVELQKPSSYTERKVPEYEEYFDLNHSKDTINAGLISSLIINVLLLTFIVFVIWKFLKMRRRYTHLLFSDVDISMS